MFQMFANQLVRSSTIMVIRIALLENKNKILKLNLSSNMTTIREIILKELTKNRPL